nr:cupin domain-containing protein [Kibdelosporangium sp. MJ126-NF4]CEL18683.1 Pectin degradation protein KdgF [Kibdelosporangium sp. MJ126-NF4]CTQ98167.1 Pectin degradation protein KdgF [Kibdelosporangium sp. MJ126-NF4]
MSDTFGSLSAMPVKAIWDNVTARVVQSELITMAVVELAPDSVVPVHRHGNEQLGFVVTGHVRFTVDGETRDRGPGDTWRILADVPHHVTVGPEGAVVVEVYSPVRHDWAALPDSAPAVPVWPVSTPV